MTKTAKTSKAYRATEGRLRCLLDKWQHPLGFSDWVVRLACYESDETFPPNARITRKERRRGFTLNMSVRTEWQYQRITISVNMAQCIPMHDEVLETTLLHELSHALIAEMNEPKGRTKHEERTATHLANVLRWVYHAGHTEARTTDAARAAGKAQTPCTEPSERPSPEATG